VREDHRAAVGAPGDPHVVAQGGAHTPQSRQAGVRHRGRVAF
jgi:hypothetical protein